MLYDAEEIPGVPIKVTVLRVAGVKAQLRPLGLGKCYIQTETLLTCLSSYLFYQYNNIKYIYIVLTVFPVLFSVRSVFWYLRSLQVLASIRAIQSWIDHQVAPEQRLFFANQPVSGTYPQQLSLSNPPTPIQSVLPAQSFLNQILSI